MIQGKLMQGDIVHHDIMKYCSVTGVRGNTVYLTSANGGIFDTTVDRVNSVELTPRVLKACGFVELKENGRLCLDGIDTLSFGQSFVNPDCVLLYEGDDYIGRPVQYLHQLQQLYYVLTGQDLTVKTDEL